VNFDATRRQVADCYGSNGQVSLDPALVMKLTFLAFYENVRSERELMRQLPLRLDWLWFCELDLDETIPNHSVLSKARRRWGREAFESLFTAVLRSCVDAGLVSDEAWHADSTLLRANASVDSRISRKLWEQLEEGLTLPPPPEVVPQVSAEAPPEVSTEEPAQVSTEAPTEQSAEASAQVGDEMPTPDATTTTSAASSAASEEEATQRVAQAGPSQAAVSPRSQTPEKQAESSRDDRDDDGAGSVPPPPQVSSPQVCDEASSSPASLSMTPAPAVTPAPPQGAFNRLTVSRTDPEAATTRRRGRGVTLGYRDHRLVDDAFGVIVHTAAMPADYDDGAMLMPMLHQMQAHREALPQRVTGDSAYGTAANYEQLRAMKVRGYLKPRPGKRGAGRWEQRLPEDCPAGAARHWLRRRLSVAEGSFAIAHARHDHRRCRWRGLVNVQIQCDLVAMVQNVGKLLRYGRPRRPAKGAIVAARALGSVRQIVRGIREAVSRTMLGLRDQRPRRGPFIGAR
jgi:IS5 family transposase